MSWSPKFTKELGFYSPNNSDAKIVAWIYRLSIPILIPLAFLFTTSYSERVVVGLALFAFFSLLYGIYAARHLQNTVE